MDTFMLMLGWAGIYAPTALGAIGSITGCTRGGQAALGAMIDVERAIVLSPILFSYVMIIVCGHFAFVYGVGRLLRLDIRVLTIASTAVKGGPPTAIAIANAHGWKSLALPGVAIGLLGYAIGNYLGFAAAYLLKLILG